jgi:hypothetical protein
MAQAFPDLRVTAVDWLHVMEVTSQCVRRHGLTDRFSLVAGDVPVADFGSGYDVATLGHILHSAGERGHALLRTTFDALAPGGTIAIAEFLVNEDRSGPPNGLNFRREYAGSHRRRRDPVVPRNCRVARGSGLRKSAHPALPRPFTADPGQPTGLTTARRAAALCERRPLSSMMGE